MVEKRGFKLLVAFLEPKFKVPLRHYSSQIVVSELYEAKESELVQYLKAIEGGAINLTTDLNQQTQCSTDWRQQASAETCETQSELSWQLVVVI